MMNWLFFKNKQETKPAKKKEETPSNSQGGHAKHKKPAKKKIPKKVDPNVTVVNFEFNPIDPKLGSIELDWNKEFVDLLKLNGYIGLTDEDIVNRWLSDVCRTIAMNDIASDNPRYIQRKDIGDGKTEVS